MDVSKIVEKYATMRKQTKQCDTCQADYDSKEHYMPCPHRADDQPHVWVERTHLLSREEAISRAIDEVLAEVHQHQPLPAC